MSGRGQPPSENARRRNETPTEHLSPEGEVPEHMMRLRNRSTYTALTLLWWDVWVNSPQAEKFEATDWMRLQMIAPLVEGYFRKPGHYALAEIRQNESLLGGTILDRMRLRMGKKDDGKGNPDDLPADVADFMKYMDKAN